MSSVFRWIFILLATTLLAPGGSVYAEELPTARPFQGKFVEAVLQGFRDEGLPLAWSSNLVETRMQVLSEPRKADPVGIIGEILRPHALQLTSTEGIYLVTRMRPDPGVTPASASLMAVLRNPQGRLLSTPVDIELMPGNQQPLQLGEGVIQFRNLQPGAFSLGIRAEGFDPVEREVRLQAGSTEIVHVKLVTSPAELETMNVSASRYLLSSSSQFFIDQRAIQNMPNVGDDPLRSAHRLPGMAAGGWSAKAHFRGGTEDESAIFLNGLQLLDPYHIRDFHNVFSSIDARTISGVEAFTGGFPVSYGDRSSGLLLLQSQKPQQPRQHELGISVFNTSLLTTGYNERGTVNWLLSARRSNLDWVLDASKHGVPSYNDLFAELGMVISDNHHLNFNMLRASDDVLVITEHKPEDEEFSNSKTLNEYAWAQWQAQWSPRLESTTVLSWISFSNQRNAVVNDPEQLVGTVDDWRKVKMAGLRQDWGYQANRAHLLKFGWEIRRQDARYNYHAQAEYQDDYLIYPGLPERLDRAIVAAPDGHNFSAYLSDRWQVSGSVILEAGLRWDKQTWQGPVAGDQWSPRINLLWSPASHLDLRLSWGSYYQSQGIQSLQVEDGLDRFFPAQKANHLILGAHWRPRAATSLRLEAYAKHYRGVLPRFENLLDPLPLIPELEPDRILLVPDSARSRGIELTLEHEFRKNLTGWASYGWSEASDRIRGQDEYRNWHQPHSFQAGLGWEPGQWKIGVALKAHSGWPTTPAVLVSDGEDGEQVLYGPRNSLQLNTFVNLDARIAREWDPGHGRLTAFFEISNLGNRQNECCVDYDIEDDDAGNEFLERSVDHWLGMTPSIGLLWEF